MESLWIVVRCVLAFLAFFCFQVALDWVIAKLFGRENSQFFGE